MITKNIVKKNTYLDSIMLMSISRQLRESEENVDEVSAIMGTQSNLEILNNIGLLTADGERAHPGDLIIAIRAANSETIDKIVARAAHLLIARTTIIEEQTAQLPKSYDGALRIMPDTNIAVISLPGEYAAFEAMGVLESGRSVMIFSDNVSIEDEIVLKKKARELGLLVMGPDCGTAIINGVALGFANIVRKGPFGIVAAAGTGIQELSTLLHKRGYGITNAIGTGGRDLSKEVQGITMLQGIEVLEKDPQSEVIILLSKPPDPEVSKMILDFVKNLKKRYIINFLNGEPEEAKKRNLPFAGGLEEAVELAISTFKKRKFVPPSFADKQTAQEQAREMGEKLEDKTFLRGLFSGGTLAEEALSILSSEIGEIYSNVPLKEELKLKDSWKSYKHTIVDLGEDEFTRGRPHPMIDFTLRCERIIKESGDTKCGVILLDVVLGYGAHPDPASVLIPAINNAQKNARADGRSIIFVASITGTEEDPQNLSRQKGALENAGVIILPSNAQAARFAGLVLYNPL